MKVGHRVSSVQPSLFHIREVSTATTTQFYVIAPLPHLLVSSLTPRVSSQVIRLCDVRRLLPGDESVQVFPQVVVQSPVDEKEQRPIRILRPYPTRVQ